jgi:hypothetical protein
MSEPDLSAASTTTTPSDRPAMMRLRWGKCLASGTMPGTCSLSSIRGKPAEIDCYRLNPVID